MKYHANNKTDLLIVKLMFHPYFERRNDKVLTFNIVHFLTVK